MIVLSRKYGQLGNRLILFAHLIAAAREHKTTLYNPSFVEYAKYFERTKSDLWCRYAGDGHDGDNWTSSQSPSEFRRQITYSSVYLSTRLLTHLRLTRFPLNILRLTGEEHIDLAGDEFRELATSNRPLMVSGWGFRSDALLEKHLDAVRDHFAIAEPYRRHVDQLITKLRQDVDCVIGIHIRHGDYARWQGGKYFFPISEYAAAMKQVRDRLDGMRVRFLVCGNAEMSHSDFGDLDVHFGTGHLIEDLYAFAETDYIVGAPSTYTRWSAIYGGTPLEYIQHSGYQLHLTRLLAKFKLAA